MGMIEQIIWMDARLIYNFFPIGRGEFFVNNIYFIDVCTNVASNGPGLLAYIRVGIIDQKQLIWVELHGRQIFS